MTDPEQLIAGWLEGSLSETEQATLDEWLKSDDEHMRQFTDAVMFEQQIQSAVVAIEEQAAAESFNTSSDDEAKMPGDAMKIERYAEQRSRAASNRIFKLVAASLILMLTLLFWMQRPSDQTFAALTQTRSALWESGDLPTADGSRLGAGTLRLAEGLATLQFDSGAEVTLEAPATLTLEDSMNCRLIGGTAVSDIPDSALGFRIKTPSADVVDYGTRFAVSVYEATGETHTQVIEGLVQVEYAESDEVVELRSGQRNVVIGEVIGAATPAVDQEQCTIPVMHIDRGPDWTMLEPTKDAYTGHVPQHNSEVLLLVKKSTNSAHANRVSYIGFDLNNIDDKRIKEAEFTVYFAPTGWGLASHVPDATFSVHGMVSDVPAWDETILHGKFPGEPKTVHLGSFQIPQGVQKGRFSINTDALSQFLRDHAGSSITLKVVRDTQERHTGGLVHGFASHRHPVLPPPTLAIRTDDE